MDYQWYPGHMTKARRMMEDNIRLVDLVIELLDARIPVSSRNPDINTLAKGKERLIILAKADLADPDITDQYLKYYQGHGLTAVAVDARTRKFNSEVQKAVQRATAAKRERDLRRGIRNRPVRAMICGIPNVGKSTFINSLSGKSGAKTGNKPGVTRGRQWISCAGMDLLDTPGILWPKFEDQQVGIRLALTGAIRDEILDAQELSFCLISILEARYPGLLGERYAVTETRPAKRPSNAAGNPADISQKDSADAAKIAYNEAGCAAVLEEIAFRRNLLGSHGMADTRRAANMLLDDYRSGRIGRITLDEFDENYSVFTEST